MCVAKAERDLEIAIMDFFGLNYDSNLIKKKISQTEMKQSLQRTSDLISMINSQEQNKDIQINDEA